MKNVYGFYFISNQSDWERIWKEQEQEIQSVFYRDIQLDKEVFEYGLDGFPVFVKFVYEDAERLESDGYLDYDKKEKRLIIPVSLIILDKTDVEDMLAEFVKDKNRKRELNK